MDERPNSSLLDLKGVIEKWKLEGEDIPLRVVPYNILYLVSRYFPPQEDWKKFAAYLGIETLQTLSELEGDAQIQNKWPSLLALISATKSSLTFADLISILHKKLIRLDAIQKLYDSGEVQAFLLMRKCGDAFKLYEEKRQFQKTLNNEIGSEELSAVLREIALRSNTNKSKNLTSVLTTKNVVPSNAVVQVNACKVEVKPCLKLSERQHSTTERKEENDEETKNSVETIQGPRPSLPTKPVILLTYSSDVNDIVPKLVQRFWNEEIGVVSEYTLSGKGVLESNPNAVWESLFRQCHFVIPVISNKYLADIHRPDDDCDQSQIVRFIYDLYVDKYVLDGCMNHIVRALVTSDVNTRNLRSVNPTLRSRWKLWNGLDTVLKMVKNAFQAQMQRRAMQN